MPVRMTAHWLERDLKPPKEGREEHFDEDVAGLLIRVTATDKRSWYLMYRKRGDLKRYRKALGPYPVVTLKKAREDARAFLSAITKGADPDEIREDEKRQDETEGPYFKDLAAAFIEKYAKVRKKSWREDQIRLKGIVLPALGSKKAKIIKRKDIVQLINDIHDGGAPIQANRTLALVRKIYNWAIERDILETSPCYMVKCPGKEQQRDRVLSEDEIRVVWACFDGLDALFGAFFKLRLLTAQRGGEVRSMAWADVDLDSGWWTIPPDQAKNGLSHRVPLSAAAVDLLEGIKPPRGGSAWVFPSSNPRTVGRPITENLLQASARSIVKASGVDFVMHDLRRTAASYMASAGVPRLVISKVLNHVEPGVTRVYDRHSYDAEKRQALEAWAARLNGILGDAKG